MGFRVGGPFANAVLLLFARMSEHTNCSAAGVGQRRKVCKVAIQKARKYLS